MYLNVASDTMSAGHRQSLVVWPRLLECTLHLRHYHSNRVRLSNWAVLKAPISPLRRDSKLASAAVVLVSAALTPDVSLAAKSPAPLSY